ncbi:MAG: alanine racemase [Wolinella sp.]
MAEIHLSSRAFFHNVDFLKTRIPASCELGAVIKDNAYGHGLLEMAHLCERAGIRHAFVKNSAEAVQVSPYFAEVSALYGDIESWLPGNIHLVVHSLEQIAQIPQNRSVELKVDTGMYRNGIAMDELYQALELLRNRGIALRGVMAHNGYGDDFGSEFFTQCGRFEEVRGIVLEYVSRHALAIPRFHSLSSSGVLRSAKEGIKDDLVRIGIALYGYLCADSRVVSGVDLRPVLSLWAKKIATKKLEQGSRIGYCGVSVLESEACVSTYDVGYGDGFPRLREGQSLKSAEGEQILPRVSMDCMSVLSEREELCLMNDARYVAECFGTIPYEILAQLSPFLPRVVKE